MLQKNKKKSMLLTSVAEAESMLQFAIELLQAGKRPLLTIEYGTKMRTAAQNRAMHLFLDRLADTLNEAGLDMRKTLKADVEIPWSGDNCKEFLWRPIQTALFGKKSSTAISTTEVNDIFSVIERHMAEKHGVRVPDWPEDYCEWMGNK